MVVKKRTIKKWIAILLAILMVISALSMQVFAAETDAEISQSAESETEDQTSGKVEAIAEDAEAEFSTEVGARAVGQAGVSKVHFYSIKSSVTTSIFGTLSDFPAKTMRYGGYNYPAYCIDQDLLQWGDIDYTWTDLSFAQQNTVKQIVAQGFSELNGLSKAGWGDAHPDGGKVGNYEPNTAQWAVTQLLVWAACGGHIVRNSETDWTWDSQIDTQMETIAQHAYNPSAFRAYYANLKEYLMNGFKIPSFAGASPAGAEKVMLQWDGSAYTATLTDTNQVLSRFDFKLDGVTFTRNGNELTISAPNEIPNPMLTERAGHAVGSGDAVAVWKCADPAIQRMATLGTGDRTPVSAYLIIQTEKRNTGGLEIRKKSEDGVLEGVAFQITRDCDDWSQTIKTDASGVARLSDLAVYNGNPDKPIQYTVTEIYVPPKYQKPDPQTVTLISEQAVTVSFENKLCRGRLKIQKVDQDGTTPLPGAVYRLLDANGTPVDEKTTDASGSICFENLAFGTYSYVEVCAPEGYELDNTIYGFAIDANGQTISKTRVNMPRVGSLTVRKVDTTNRPMAGVSFLLEFLTDNGTSWKPVAARSEDGGILTGGCTSSGLADGVLKTDAQGMAAFTGLQIDHADVTVLYRLTEIRTQGGNNLLTRPLFEGSLPLDDGSVDVEYTAVNSRSFELPSAGGRGFLAVAAGLTLTVVSGVLLILMRRKNT